MPTEHLETSHFELETVDLPEVRGRTGQVPGAVDLHRRRTASLVPGRYISQCHPDR